MIKIDVKLDFNNILRIVSNLNHNIKSFYEMLHCLCGWRIYHEQGWFNQTLCFLKASKLCPNRVWLNETYYEHVFEETNVYFFIGRIQQIKFNEIYAIDIKYNKVILVIRKYFLTPV